MEKMRKIEMYTDSLFVIICAFITFRRRNKKKIANKSLLVKKSVDDSTKGQVKERFYTENFNDS